MRFGMLGPLEVWAADGSAVRIPEVKVRTLLAHLLVQRGRPVPAGRLIEDLWGDQLPANPAAVLRSKVSQLRRVLRDAGPDRDELVLHRPPGYLLRVGAGAVDADGFAALLALAGATDDPRSRAALLAEALSLWRGPALADFAEAEFARAAVARLEEQRLTALEDQLETRLALGEDRLLVGDLADLVDQHPLRERFRAVQMRALYRTGRQAEALASFRDLRDRLRDRLGLDPGPDLVALQQAILRQDPALAAPPAGAGPAGGRRGNLPSPPGRLIGRDHLLAPTSARLGEGRLVTLVGPGGVGKTRLALATAGRVAAQFPDGVWLVELSGLERTRAPAGGADRSVTTLAAAAELVARVLGLRDDPAGAPVPAGPASGPPGQLTGALRDRQLLLVLDNCEHVIEPIAELAGQLLGAAPGLRILATSQEPMGLADELVVAVPPLDPPGPAAEADLATLRRASAVQLFLARATAAAPDFTLTSRNAAAVATICRRLDGLPLALELAATRVRALGVAELADRLDDRFRVLAAGRRGAPPRQQTLQAMIDWSWQLLTGPEQVVLRRLAVHADGCVLAAAEQVCGGDELPPGEVVDLLTHLVDRSLVVLADHPDGPRYRLLESVTAYCLDRLAAAGELDRLRQRHARYYAALAERAAPQLRGHAQHQWLRRLDAETSNLRAALETAVRDRDGALALRLTCALAWYWVLRGRLHEGRRSLAAALASPDPPSGDPAPPGDPAVVRATGRLWHAGMTALAGEIPDPTAVELGRTPWLGDGGADPGGRGRALLLLATALPVEPDRLSGTDLMKQLLTTFRAIDDPWGTAAALSALAWEALTRSEFAGLRRDAEQSLALFTKLGDRWGILQATGPLAALAQITGDYRQAARLHRDGLRIARELGLWPQVAYKLNELGRIALLAGDYPQADELHGQAMRLAAEHSHKAVEQFAALGLAISSRRQGRLAAAEQRLLPWLDWNRAANWDQGTARVLAELGFIAEQRGEAETALQRQLAGYRAARASGNPRTIALALEGLAGAQALRQCHDLAGQLLGTAAAIRESVGVPLPEAERGDVDRTTARVRAALGGEAFQRAFRSGRRLDPDGSVAPIQPATGKRR
jgi:predicted ATPase/DNA-binding SARP family transcriptional activator